MPPQAEPNQNPQSQTQPTVDPQAQQNPGHQLGVASLIVSFFIPPLGVILGLVGLSKSKRAGMKNGLAIAGAMIGSVGMIAYILFFTLVVGAIRKSSSSLDKAVQESSQQATQSSNQAIPAGFHRVDTASYSLLAPDQAVNTSSDTAHPGTVLLNYEASYGYVKIEVFKSSLESIPTQYKGEVSTSSVSVNGITTERTDQDARKVFPFQGPPTISYQILLPSIKKAGDNERTDFSLILLTVKPASDADVEAFKKDMQVIIDSLQIK